MKQGFNKWAGAILILLVAVTVSTSCKKSKDDSGGVDTPPPAGTVFDDDFSSDKGTFAPANTEKYKASVKDGHLSIELKGVGQIIRFLPVKKTFFTESDKKQTIELKAKKTTGLNGDNIGLVFNYLVDDTYVGFEIKPYQKLVRVFQYIKGTGKNFLNWTNSDPIKGNPGDYNTLQITLQDEKINFSINGTVVFTLNAGPVKTLDTAAIDISSNPTTSESNTHTVLVDYFRALK